MSASAPQGSSGQGRATRIELLNGHISWLLMELAAAYRDGRPEVEIAQLEDALTQARQERQQLVEEELSQLAEEPEEGTGQ
ncbi:MAG: hypothetical protein GX774_19920 [Armatimonadetes bacterium]|nr:hypothetical protein [Armatimonadota bacterium]